MPATHPRKEVEIMRNIRIAAALTLGALAMAAVAVFSARPTPPAFKNDDSLANLPIVVRPENTPTPTATLTAVPSRTSVPTRTPAPTSTDGPPPTPPATATLAPSPTPGFGPNLLANGSFEDGWTDLPPAPGNLINQEPHSWELTWLEIGEGIWDLRTIHPDDPTVGVVSGIPEMLHKLDWQLPPHEQPGGPNALILEGTAVYKLFHRGAAFGSQLYQAVDLPAGTYRLTVPVQLHWHEKLDPDDPTWDTFTAESGAWVLVGETRLGGGWATARDMGDRRWFYHVVEFTIPAQTEVGVLIRVKSIYRSPKDFFIDAVWLEKIG